MPDGFPFETTIHTDILGKGRTMKQQITIDGQNVDYSIDTRNVLTVLGTVFITHPFEFRDMKSHRQAMDACRELYRQFQSRMLRDAASAAYRRFTLNMGDIRSQELGGTILSGAIGLMFMITMDEPTDISYDPAEWTEETLNPSTFRPPSASWSTDSMSTPARPGLPAQAEAMVLPFLVHQPRGAEGRDGPTHGTEVHRSVRGDKPIDWAFPYHFREPANKIFHIFSRRSLGRFAFSWHLRQETRRSSFPASRPLTISFLKLTPFPHASDDGVRDFFILFPPRALAVPSPCRTFAPPQQQNTMTPLTIV